MNARLLCWALLLTVSGCNPWGTPLPSTPPAFDPRLGTALLELLPNRPLVADSAPAGGGAFCIAATVGAGHDFDFNEETAEVFVARVDGNAVTRLPSPPFVGEARALVSVDQCAVGITDEGGLHIVLFNGNAWVELPPPPDLALTDLINPIAMPSEGTVAAQTGPTVIFYDGNAWRTLTSMNQIAVAALDATRMTAVGLEGGEAVSRTVLLASGATESEQRLTLPVELEPVLRECRTGTVDAGVFIVGDTLLSRSATALTLGGPAPPGTTTLFPTPGTAAGEGVIQVADPIAPPGLFAVTDGSVGNALLPGFASDLSCECDRFTDATCGCVPPAVLRTQLVPVTPTRTGLVIVSDIFATLRLSVRVLALPQSTSPFGGDVAPSACTPECEPGFHCATDGSNNPVCVDNNGTDAQISGTVRDPTGTPPIIDVAGASTTAAANGNFVVTVPRAAGLTVVIRSLGALQLVKQDVDTSAGGTISLGNITMAIGRDLGLAPAVRDARTVIHGSYVFVPVDGDWVSVNASVLPLNLTAAAGGTVRLIPRRLPLRDEALVSSTTGLALVNLFDGTLLQGVSNSLDIDLKSAEITFQLVALPYADGSLEIYRLNQQTLQLVTTSAGPVRALAGGRGRTWIENNVVMALDFADTPASLGSVAATARAIPVGPGVAVITPVTGAGPCEDSASGCSVEYRDFTTTSAVTAAAGSVSALATFVVYSDMATGEIVVHNTEPGAFNPITRLTPPAAPRRGKAVIIGDTWIMLPGDDLLVVDPRAPGVFSASQQTRGGGWRVLGVDDAGCGLAEAEACPGPGCQRAAVCSATGTVTVVDGGGAAVLGAPLTTCGDAQCAPSPFAFASSITVDPAHTTGLPSLFAPCILFKHEPGAGFPAELMCGP